MSRQDYTQCLGSGCSPARKPQIASSGQSWHEHLTCVTKCARSFADHLGHCLSSTGSPQRVSTSARSGSGSQTRRSGHCLLLNWQPCLCAARRRRRDAGYSSSCWLRRQSRGSGLTTVVAKALYHLSQHCIHPHPRGKSYSPCCGVPLNTLGKGD